VGAVKTISSVAELVNRMEAEYLEARSRLSL